MIGGRKVQFEDGATVTSFKLPRKEGVYQQGIAGSKKLIPLHNSPVPPPMAAPPSNEDLNLPSIMPERMKSPPTPVPERRFSVTMPKEKKAELLTALKEQRLPSNERRQTVAVPGGSAEIRQLPHYQGSKSFSIEHSESDDFVDNLTKQKMNLQLKSVTDRISEVC